MNRRLVVAGLLATVAAALVTGAFVLDPAGGGDGGPAERDARMVPAPGSNVKAHGRVVVDGATWYLTSFEDLDGNYCLAEHYPGGGVGTGCASPKELFARSALWAGAGSTQDPGETGRWAKAWVSGRAAPVVERLELTLSDCSRIPVRLDADRVFLHVMSAEQLRRSTLPARLTAFGADGTKVESLAVDLGPSGPWSTPFPSEPQKPCR